MSGRGDLEAWLEAGAGSGDQARAVHETPIAKVFVFGDRVLKLKKPVDFGFLDFTTCAKREWAVRRELEFNRRTAPDVYRAVHPVTCDAAHGLALGGHGEVVDHVLEMRPFDDDAVLSNHPDQVDGEMAERLGRDIACFQAEAPRTAHGGADGLAYVLDSNADQLRTLSDLFGQEAVEGLIAGARSAFDQVAPLLDARRDAGFVRRCHGDLHLGNIFAENGQPVLFDCIEFNDRLSDIDVAYDVAFILMDLGFHGRGEAASRALNAWLDESGRGLGAERLDGLAALPLFQSVRAAVRAHVSGHGGERERARGYFRAAEAHLQPAPRRLVAIGGLSGSGKSTLARRLAPRLGRSPGAVLIRTDEVRKRMSGARPTERLPPAAYAPEVSLRVYGLMLEEARRALDAGMSVILDAAFLKPGERDDAEALGRTTGAPFQGLWMRAAPGVLRQRLRTRRGDTSDADEAVLERQLEFDLGEIAWRRIDAGAPSEAQLAAALT